MLHIGLNLGLCFSYLDWDSHWGSEDSFSFQSLDNLGNTSGDGVFTRFDNALWAKWGFIGRIDTSESYENKVSK